MSAKAIKVGILSRAQINEAARRPQSRTRKARIGFIGVGWWATTNHMPVLFARKDVELVSACGLDTALNQRLKGDFGFQHTTTDYRELLKQDLDGVVVASPHGLHGEHTLAALKVGCHVMVEKPMATSAHEARAMVALAKKKRLHLMVPYGWHYRPIGVKAHELMKSNPVGEIEYVLCHMASPVKNLMSGKSFDYMAGSYVGAKLSTWADPRISHGGYGQGQLSHALGLMLWLTGLRGKSVYANMSKTKSSKVDMYDSLSVCFDGGVIGSVSGAGTLPMGTPGTFQLDVRIFGSKGVVVVDIARDHLSVDTHKGRHETISLKPGDGAYQCDAPPHQFVELILGLTKSNPSPGEIGMRAVEILDTAYRSVKSGRVEKV